MRFLTITITMWACLALLAHFTHAAEDGHLNQCCPHRCERREDCCCREDDDG